MNRAERRRLEKQNRMQKKISPLMREHVLKDAIHQLQKNNLNQAGPGFNRAREQLPTRDSYCCETSSGGTGKAINPL